MAKSKAAKVAAVPAPQDLNEAGNFVSRIGEMEREIEKQTGEMNEKIEAMKEPYLDKVTGCRQRIDKLVTGLYAYAESHRKELTEDEKRKTVNLPTGVFGWRLTPKSVSIKGVKAVLERLEQLKLTQFIREKKEIDKESMLKEESIAAAVEGVTISQREEFFVKPAESGAEVSVTPGRQALKVALAAGPRNKPAQKKSA